MKKIASDLSIIYGCIACLIAITILPQPAWAQRKKNKSNAEVLSYDTALYSGIPWRLVGPFRGGRSGAVTGVPGEPNLFYFGATGGGVWKTEDGGQTWGNISDGYFGGSIGAVTVSDYDHNVIYVGGGEETVRGNVSYGYGMWKSTDAGTSWKQIGLEDSRHIARIRVHPKDPDLVYVAAMGNLFAPNEQRGIFRSKDGGKTWEKVLFVSNEVGAVDLTFDPNNPRILYASTWRIKRTPYSLESGGEGSGLWKSTDSGDTWKNISDNEGMPKGPLGIIGITVSPLNSSRLWAIIEAKDGGVFRSDDAGKTWQQTNTDRNLQQRAWYYNRIYADTQNEDKVWVMNVSYGVSKDGGNTFELKNAPHGDHHDLWIDPNDNQRMIIADDGGAQVSFDAGENWTTYYNQPTAQFYRVVTDDHFPYRIYGAQQDNTTVRIAHRSDGSTITEDDWDVTAGGESAHLAPDPENNDIVYGGSYGGLLERMNHDTKQNRLINVWPDNPMGYGAEGMRYRFQWNAPVFFSPHNPNKLYTASNHLHVSTNEGQSWKIISPDLTRNDSTTLKSSGGPITQDNTGVEYYGTIFAVTESPDEEGVIWTGSDDGLMYITRDGGENWEEITPPDMPEWMMFNSIEIDPFVKGGAYVAGTRYKMGDFTPYLYKTKDYGKTWTKITDGIDPEHFTRVVRADPKRKGLLYAGTETGMYISFDDGASWKPFQNNLPIVPITDLTIKDDNLIAATQGRSFWMIDDITPLHQLDEGVAAANFHLFDPMPTYRIQQGGGWGGSDGPSLTEGENHPDGVMIHYFLRNKPDTSYTASIKIMEMNGTVIKEYSTKVKPKSDDVTKGSLKSEQGFNRFVWDMRYPDAETFEGMILWGGGTKGPMAVPGKYKVAMTVNGDTQESEFEILPDPRAEATQADYQAQFDFLKSVRDKLSETNATIKKIRTMRGQISTVTDKVKDDEQMKDIIEMGKTIDEKMTKVEKALYQTKNQGRQDPLNFPIKLNNKLANVASQMGNGNFKPTDQAVQFKDEITKEIDVELTEFQDILKSDIPDFNKLVKDKGVDAISTEKEPSIP